MGKRGKSARRIVKTQRRSAKRVWRPVKHPGSLKKLGYDPDDKPPEARRRALTKAVRRYGYARTMRKLGFLKGAARVPVKVKKNVSEDIEWMKERYKR